MRIACCSFNTCIRATQTSLAAKDMGHEVFIVSHIESAVRQFNETFDGTLTFHTDAQLFSVLKMLKPDIIHWHDRPHRFPAMLVDPNVLKQRPGDNEALPDKPDAPIVHDLHDMFSLMVPGASAPEDSPFEDASILGADALVFVSESNRDTLLKKYGALPPNVVVRSGVYSRLYPVVRGPRIGAGVWGGGLYVENPGSPRRYIDQREIVLRFAAVGQSAVIYHAPTENPNTPDIYRDAGAIIAGMAGYQRMLFAYSRYDFGWYGQTEDHGQIHGTIPNKLAEYLAAGIPTVVINAKAAGKFVEENGIGIHIRRPEDIIYRRDELEALRPVVWEKRWEFTREKECEKLWPLYTKLAEAASV